MTVMAIRDVRLFVDVVGRGYPLALMHGGPGADHWTLLPFRQLADRFTVVFYDHRCNGRSAGAPVTSMTSSAGPMPADILVVRTMPRAVKALSEPGGGRPGRDGAQWQRPRARTRRWHG